MSSPPPQRDPSSAEGDQQPAGRGGDSGGGVRRALRAVGPGIVTGAADDDPSGIATYAQSGALYGTGLLWTVPLTLPLMIVVQEACERMTLATGDSFGALIRRRFQRGARTWITLHGEAGSEREAEPSRSDPLRNPAPHPGEVPARDPDIAPPTAPERAPAPEEDPEVPPLTDPEFDFRDPHGPTALRCDPGTHTPEQPQPDAGITPEGTPM